ncbi:metallophosphoesterase family protein [Syntrophomonas wolfei]|mgnify:FL=1|jgi:hypothetical protein|uniref:metallophosphoesterase family protein n=1 Tax=Syntrophomonas wolfei TaxID=863 RepID=UPI000773D6A5|nr:metallophosphoesterase family protein [Syntrophomonas wolfei]
MRLGIVSDTHGNVKNLRRVAEELTENRKVDCIIHLGDECEDIKVLDEFKVTVLLVHGVYCRHYQDPDIPNRIFCRFDGYRFLLTHTDSKHKNDLPDDPDPQELAIAGEVDIILYGHTHIPGIKRENAVIWLNPGHLKDEDKKGYGPSFAVIETDDKGILLQIIELNTGKVLEELEIKKDLRQGKH